MKKLVLCLLTFFLLFTLVSCSEESKEKRIYNSNKDDITKMDELRDLYYSSRKTTDYSDAAWNQIEKGNYNTALGLIQASGTTGGNSAAYYLSLLQKRFT